MCEIWKELYEWQIQAMFCNEPKENEYSLLFKEIEEDLNKINLSNDIITKLKNTKIFYQAMVNEKIQNSKFEIHTPNILLMTT